ncbi:hypothetical protein C7460_104150 [Marinoscillum furvescens DSM 4134]|uniref:Uncharacterized protein n=1 Tax=Marinoscillum furvescens DSM 4134 TaxID=1122208 RepID=A0A3D9L751_MARFU|nr:hypothetical protein C7460_104150 [Marinoscillum furvescens DSM 4134]
MIFADVNVGDRKESCKKVMGFSILRSKNSYEKHMRRPTIADT